MATTGETGKLSPSGKRTDSGKFVEYDRFIDNTLRKTRQQVRNVDIASSVMLLGAGTLAYFLLVALVDHWVVSGGLGTVARYSLLGLYLGGAAVYCWRSILPLLVRRINPVYAAYSIESSKPTLKNSLINFLLLRANPAGLTQNVFEAIEEQAATNLAKVPVEGTVDHSKLIRIGYVFLAVLVVSAIYKIVSPKDPLRTLGRVVLPWADIDPATRVRILGLEPGDATVFRGQVVSVKAEVQGLPGDEPVTLYYTTADGQLVGRAIPLKIPAAGYLYECQLPEGKEGIQQDVTYRLVAGDAVSRPYQLQVQAAPTIVVESVEYRYPDYTGLVTQTVEHQPDIKGIEGTEVTIRAVANQPIKQALIDFDCNGSEDQQMTFTDRQASVTFTLALKEDHQTPAHTSYQLTFANTDGQQCLQPIRHQIEVSPDVAPEIQFLAPKRDEVEVPLNQALACELSAADPDYALSSVTLVGTLRGRPLVRQALLEEIRTGQFVSKPRLSPKKLGLTVGDVLEYWAWAEDNKSPQPNHVETPHRRLKVVSPTNAPPNQDELAQNDEKPNPKNRPRPDQNPQAAKNPQAGEQQQQNGDNQDSGDNQQPGEGGQQGDGGQQGGAGNQAGQNQAGQQQGKPGDQSGGNEGQGQNQGAGGENGRDNQDPSNSNAGQDPAQQNQSQQNQSKQGAGQQAQQNGAGQQGDQNQNGAGQQQGGGNQQNAGGGQGQKQESGGPVAKDGSQDGEAFEKILQRQGEQGQKNGLKPQDDTNHGGKPSGNDQNKQIQGNESGGSQPQPAGSGDKPADPSNEKGPQGQKAEAGQGGNDSGQKAPPGAKGTASGSKPGGNASGEQNDQPGAPTGEPDDTPGAKPAAQPQPGGADDQSNQKGQPYQGKPDATAGQGKSGDRADDQTKGESGAGSQKPGEETKPGAGGGKGADAKGGLPQKNQPKPAGEPQGEKSGGEGDNGTAQSGAGHRDGDKQSATPPQGANAPRNKTPDGDKQGPKRSGGEPASPSISNHQSNKKGQQAGDRSGDGGEGGGQEGSQPGVGGEGQNSPSDEGSGTADERGQGETADRPGVDKQAAGQAGEGGNQPGQGSHTRPGASQQQKTPGQKGGQPDDAGGEGDQHPDQQADPSNPKQPGTPGGASRGVPQGTGHTEDAANPTPPPAVPDQADDVNLDFARKATELAIKRLRDQINKGDVDQKLLDELGWEKEDLNRWVRGYENLYRKAGAKGDQGKAAKAELDATLRSLGIHPRGTQIKNHVGDDRTRGMKESRRSRPPAEYAEQFRAYTQGTARVRPEAAPARPDR